MKTLPLALAAFLAVLPLARASDVELGDVATPDQIWAELQENEDVADYLDADPTARLGKNTDISKYRVQILVTKHTGLPDPEEVEVIVDGVPTMNYLTSTGTSGFDTPAGIFKVDRMEYTWTSTIYDARMDRAIFFNGGIALHATYGKNIGLLGTRQSHGCVRQSPENADKLFALVKKYGPANTVIVVRENAPGYVAAPKKKNASLSPQAESAIMSGTGGLY